jgi:DNA-binding transcriptional ArsR family regulator
MFQGPEGH